MVAARNKEVLNRFIQMVSLRAIRLYRMVSTVEAQFLGTIPPADPLTKAKARVAARLRSLTGQAT